MNPMAATKPKPINNQTIIWETVSTHGFGRDSALCTSHVFLCCLFPLPAKLQRQTRHLCRCTARGRSGAKKSQAKGTHLQRHKKSSQKIFKPLGSPKFFPLLETLFNVNGRIHTPSRGVYFQVLEVDSQQFKLCGRGWFVSLGEMVCFFDAKSFHTFSFLSVQNWYSKSFGSVGIEKMLENKHVHTTGSHHMRVLFFQADVPLDTVL